MDGGYFTREGNATYRPGDHSRSAWGPDVLHGGPVAGLLAHAAEALLDPGLLPARMTADLFRPVPMAPLETRARVLRGGRRIQVVESTLLAAGVEVCRATTLALLPGGFTVPEASHAHRGPPSSPEEAGGGPLFPGNPAMMPWTGFHTTIEVRRVSGEPGSGRGVAWLRLPHGLIADEPMSPFVHAATMSDFANGLGHIRSGDGQAGFINADITLQLHRLPEGDWLGMEATAAADPEGIAVNLSTCFDRRGSFGRVMQTLLANGRPASAPKAK